MNSAMWVYWDRDLNRYWRINGRKIIVISGAEAWDLTMMKGWGLLVKTWKGAVP